LSQEERLALVKLLLNPRVKKFEFEVLGGPAEYCDIDDLSADDFWIWDVYFDDIWTELAAKCPNLLSVREMRPLSFWVHDVAPLSTEVFTFSQLTRLETSCTINSGMYIFSW